MEIEYRKLEQADEPILRAFIEGLPPETKRKRFLGDQSAVSLARMLLKTGYRLAAFESEKIVGLGNIGDRGDGFADIALVIADGYQRQKIGSNLAVQLAGVAKGMGYKGFRADIERQNKKSMAFAKALAEKTGSKVTEDPNATGYHMIGITVLLS